MRKKNKNVEEMARNIREEYAYMDEIPLEGWIWEFVRRDPSFRSAFDTIKTVQAKHKVVPWPFPDGFLKADRYIGSIVDRGPFLDPSGATIPGYLILWGGGVSVYSRELPAYWGFRYPDPNLRYCDFGLSDADIPVSKPLVKGTNPFVIKEYSTLEENILKTLRPIYIEERMEALSPKEQLDEIVDEIAEMVRMGSLGGLKIGKSGNTICVGISKKAKMEEIKTELLPALAGFLNRKKPKIRDDKWKYYLIVYDLKSENQDMSYDGMAESLTDMFLFDDPDRAWEAKTVENHYKNAFHLIHGGYKQYLYR